MGPLKKNDVKNHLSIRDRNGKRLHPSPSVADATGFSDEESGRAEALAAPEESLLQAALLDHPASLTPVLVTAVSKRGPA